MGLKDVVGEWPGYVWWWDFGEREEAVERNCGGSWSERVVERGFDVPVVGFERRIGVEMVGRVVLRVE